LTSFTGGTSNQEIAAINRTSSSNSSYATSSTPQNQITRPSENQPQTQTEPSYASTAPQTGSRLELTPIVIPEGDFTNNVKLDKVPSVNDGLPSESSTSQDQTNSIEDQGIGLGGTGVDETDDDNDYVDRHERAKKGQGIR
jgi:hypothetical protein